MLFEPMHDLGDTGAVLYQAQLVEHCTDIAKALGSYPVHAWIFCRLYFTTALDCSQSPIFPCDRIDVDVDPLMRAKLGRVQNAHG